jgi:hypothetical protein
MEKYVCIVPRNVNKPDVIINYKQIKLNWKQMGYLGIGLIGSYLTFNTGFPIVVKIVMMTGSFCLGIIGSVFEHKGSTLDELVLDSIQYTQRKVYYDSLKTRGDFVVTIGSKEESFETRKKINFSFS